MDDVNTKIRKLFDKPHCPRMVVGQRNGRPVWMSVKNVIRTGQPTKYVKGKNWYFSSRRNNYKEFCQKRGYKPIPRHLIRLIKKLTTASFNEPCFSDTISRVVNFFIR